MTVEEVLIKEQAPEEGLSTPRISRGLGRPSLPRSRSNISLDIIEESESHHCDGNALTLGQPSRVPVARGIRRSGSVSSSISRSSGRRVSKDDLLSRSHHMRRHVADSIASSSIDLLEDFDLSSESSDSFGADHAEPEEEFEMGDPIHDESTRLGRIRNRWGAVVNSTPVQVVNGSLIVANAALLGALTFLYDDPEMTAKLEDADLFMMSFFTLENASQLFYHGKKYFENKWLIFDGFIVLLSGIFNNSSNMVLRSFRIFRVFILISKFKSFRLLMKAIAITLPRLYTITGCLMMIFYVFMVLFTNLYNDLFIGDGSGRPDMPAPDSPLDYDYFGRLDRTFLSLFQLMLTTSWSALVRQVVDVRIFSSLGFYFWIILTAILFMNLVVAIVCGSLIEMNNMKAQLEKTKELERQKQNLTEKKQDMVDDNQKIISFQREILANNVQIQKAILILSKNITGAQPEGKTKEMSDAVKSWTERNPRYYTNPASQAIPSNRR